jgi:hypothetical protein
MPRFPTAGVDGAWSCEACNNTNFATREVCNRCAAPKPFAYPAPQQHSYDPYPSYGAPAVPQHLDRAAYVAPAVAAYPAAPARPAYGATSPYPAFPAFAPSPQRSHPLDNPGNWACLECSNINFPHRTECNRCQSKKPEKIDEDKHTTAGAMLNVFGSVDAIMEFLTGLDEKAIESAKALAKRHSKYGKGSQVAAGYDGGEFKRKKGQPVEGENGAWVCPSATCSNVNFASRVVCNMCQSARPDEA